MVIIHMDHNFAVFLLDLYALALFEALSVLRELGVETGPNVPSDHSCELIDISEFASCFHPSHDIYYQFAVCRGHAAWP